MNDKLYKDFKSVIKDFNNETRAFCYDLCIDLIKKAKRENSNWYTHKNSINAIVLILYCWNFAAPITKKINSNQIKDLLSKNKMALKNLENVNIATFKGTNEKEIFRLFKNFKNEFGQTGASKALSILNPKLFVMWDTKIRNNLKKEIIKGIANGEKPEHYIIFLKGIRDIIIKNDLCNQISPKENIAKKMDEYHYVKFVMV